MTTIFQVLRLRLEILHDFPQRKPRSNQSHWRVKAQWTVTTNRVGGTHTCALTEPRHSKHMWDRHKCVSHTGSSVYKQLTEASSCLEWVAVGYLKHKPPVETIPPSHHSGHWLSSGIHLCKPRHFPHIVYSTLITRWRRYEFTDMWEGCRTAHRRHTVKISVDGNQPLQLRPPECSSLCWDWWSSLWPGEQDWGWSTEDSIPREAGGVWAGGHGADTSVSPASLQPQLQALNLSHFLHLTRENAKAESSCQVAWSTWGSWWAKRLFPNPPFTLIFSYCICSKRIMWVDKSKWKYLRRILWCCKIFPVYKLFLSA